MGTYFDINEPGCSIRCKLYCADPHDVRRVVVFCHGFGGHKDNRAAETFAMRVVTKRKGTAVVTFDWPCHGSDARKNLLLEDCDAYLRVVIDYCKRRFGTDELYAYGTSFGGYLLLKYLSEHGNPFRKVALRCPAINMRSTLLVAIATEEDRQKLQMLIRTFFDVLHGWHVQYNVVSRETLLDAQKHPEKYPDLIVRVAGYSAFFNVLSPQTQNDIIARTEQTI